MTKLTELTDAELDLVGGGDKRHSGSSLTVISVPILSGNGNHDGNGNTVTIGSGNGVNLFVPYSARLTDCRPSGEGRLSFAKT